VRISSQQQVILGAPGCGKTTDLLSTMDEVLRSGVAPSQLAFVSFTRKAATEAMERAATKFAFRKSDLPFFKTLHSLTFQQLGLRSGQLLGFEDYRKLGDALGLKFSFASDIAAELNGQTGDVVSFLESVSRSRLETLEETYAALGGFAVEWRILERYRRTLEHYKKTEGKIDFTDMLTLFVERGEPLPVEVAFIDEAQDLSKLQWQVCQLAFKNAEKVFIAGDDDQAIYNWAGADVDTFLALEGDVKVLEKSHRLPRKIHAITRAIASRISNRREKEFSCREEEGDIQYYTDVEYVDFSKGRFMILSRNTRSLSAVEETIRKKGYAYVNKRGSSVKENHITAIITWERLRDGKEVAEADAKSTLELLKKTPENREHIEYLEARKSAQPIDAKELKLTNMRLWHDELTGISIQDREYYLSILRNGEKLNAPPRIQISTIHAVKGGECENVVLLSDMSPRTYEGYIQHPDSEHRVFYVAVSRSSNTLHIIQPQTPRYYDFPRVA
jgi:DNA helicase II / ATP-dependent DNA helicase PcrA